MWPYLIRVFSSAYGSNIYRIAIFLSGIIAVLAMVLSKYVFHKLARNKVSSLVSLSLYVLSPMSVFLFVGYTESVFAFESWILVLLIINILMSRDSYSTSCRANCFLVFATCAGLGLTRPTLPQAAFATIVTLFLTLKITNDESLARRKKYVHISMLILAGFVFGYIVYGLICLSNGFRFFEPFYVQQLWNKSFGIRPIYLLTSRSPFDRFYGSILPIFIDI